MGAPDFSTDEIGVLDQDIQTGSELLAKREKDLVGARDEANSANQAKSDFLSRMSHELRTPMNAILGFGQLIDKTDLSETNRSHLGQILKAGKHLLALINDVLDIARIEAGRMDLSLEPVRLGEVIQEVTDLAGPLALQQDVSFDIHVELPPGRLVVADRQRLKQAFLNLVSNGIKYNNPGGLLSVNWRLVGDDRVRIDFTDTGRGIAPDRFDRLFGEFERLGADATATEGTGLGLALTKNLVEAMGGSISVTSELGRGSTFTVELPAADAAPVPLEKAVVKEVAATNGSNGRHLRLLYIEDNLVNLRLVEAILMERPGTELISAMQGRLGLEMAKLHDPDLVLLDLHLPDMPGELVLKQLKSDPATSEIPVVVLTADSFEGTRRRLTEAGIAAFLSKPLELESLLGVIEATTNGAGDGS